MDHATMRRHPKTHAPRNPSTAPTQMNTVPSGRLDLCMNGAPLVSGTIRDGIEVTTPAIVGALERRPETTVEAVVEAAIVVAAVVVAAVVDASEAAVVVAELLAVVVAVVAVVPVIVLRFGRSLSVDCARVVAAKRMMLVVRIHCREGREGAIGICREVVLCARQAFEEELFVFVREIGTTRWIRS